MTTVRVTQDMNESWMEAHPDLAGKFILEFIQEHPPERWTLSIVKSEVPGMTISLCASRKVDHWSQGSPGWVRQTSGENQG